MKRVIVLLILAIIIAAPVAAQEHQAAQPAQAGEHGQASQKAAEEHGAASHGEAGSGGHGGGHASNLDKWKWANFAILVGIIAYALYKKGGAFFSGRTAAIRRDLDESAKIKADAEARYAEMERRLANLGAEIEALKAQSANESAAEGERVRQETARELAKVQAQAQQEIAAAAKSAQQELRAHAAELAVGLAEARIRRQLTPDADAAFIASMASDLERRGAAQEARVS